MILTKDWNLHLQIFAKWTAGQFITQGVIFEKPKHSHINEYMWHMVWTKFDIYTDPVDVQVE